MNSERSDEFSTGMNVSQKNNQTSVVPENLLSGMVINGRYQIGDSLGSGFTGFVRSGMSYRIYLSFSALCAAPPRSLRD